MVSYTGSTVWNGSMRDGIGTVIFTSSQAAEPLTIAYPTRANAPERQTTPEELLGMAQSSCYSMVLSGDLTAAGFPPEKIETSTTVSFSEDGDLHIELIELNVEADVPGIDDERFLELAEGAKEACCVSKLVRGNVDLRLRARLRNVR